MNNVQTILQMIPEPVMESLYEIRNAQPPKDRLHYFDVVLEGSIEKNAIMLQKLYSDIISRSNIDFADIPDSKGNLVRYKGYKLIQEAMDSINFLFDGKNSEEVKLMNRLHDIIIHNTKDYEFGYKFDIEMIKLTYNLSVMTLYEMINVCILAFTKSMRPGAKIEFGYVDKKSKKNLLVIRGAKSLVRIYENGQWAKIVKEFKKNPTAMNQVPMTATEGVGMNIIASGLKGAANIASKAAAFNPDHNVGGFVAGAANIIGKVPKPVKIVGTIAIAFIAFLLAIRGIVYVYYHSSMKLNDYVKAQKEIVEITTSHDIQNGSAEVNEEKRGIIASKLQSISDFIEIRILKTDRDATKDLEESNRENFVKSDFTQFFDNDDVNVIEF